MTEIGRGAHISFPKVPSVLLTPRRTHTYTDIVALTKSFGTGAENLRLH